MRISIPLRPTYRRQASYLCETIFTQRGKGAKDLKTEKIIGNLTSSSIGLFQGWDFAQGMWITMPQLNFQAAQDGCG